MLDAPSSQLHLGKRRGRVLARAIFRSERGVAFVETAIIFPFFVLLLFGIYNIGRGLIDYLNVTHIAHEGVRLLANTPDLEAAPSPFTAVYTTVYDLTTPTNPSVVSTNATDLHKKVHLRVATIVGLLGLQSRFTSNRVTITTQYFDGTATSNKDTVFCQISAGYQTFGTFFAMGVNVRERGPYMF